MPPALKNSVLVYDVGGSHVAAALCTVTDGSYRLGTVASAPYSAEQSPIAFIDLIHSLGVEAAGSHIGVLGAALAFPGPFDFSAGISKMRHKLPYLYDVDLRSAISERFGWQPNQLRFLLDSAAFLLGEIGAGAAAGVQRAAGITLGTGVGSALAVDGRIVTAGAGVPPGGEIWNLPYEGGIIEDFVSTRAILNSYQRRTGIQIEVARIAAAVNDLDATEAFAEFGHHLGLALRASLAAFAPQVVVLGGGISRSAHLFLPAAEHELQGLNMKLRVSTLLDHAALIGGGVDWFNGKCNRG